MEEASDIFMIEPLPNAFSIWSSAVSSMLCWPPAAVLDLAGFTLAIRGSFVSCGYRSAMRPKASRKLGIRSVFRKPAHWTGSVLVNVR
jgi:hypothetical protein